MSRKSKQSEPSTPEAPNLSDISNVQEVLTQQAFKADIAKLEKLNVAYLTQVDNLLKELEKSQDEVRHLKQLLMGSNVPIIGEATKIMLSDEEAIAEKQLSRLKALSMERDLTLDEVKRFDLLVKNKRLAQGNPTTIDASAKSLPKDLPAEQLMQIAAKKIEV